MRRNIVFVAAALALAVLLVRLHLGVGETNTQASTVAEQNAPTAASTTSPLVQSLPIHTVGGITWHAKNYLNTAVRVRGYLLRKGTDYGIFSDEKTGSVAPHDLLAIPTGGIHLYPGQMYLLEGTLVLNTSSDNSRTRYMLEVAHISSQN